MARTKQTARDRQMEGLAKWALQQLATPTPTDGSDTASPAAEDGAIKVEATSHDMPTPAPTTADNTPTPKPVDRSAFPRRTFKKQREKDRKAAENVIAKEIAKLQRADMWPRMTVEERREVVVERYESTMEMRAKHPMWWSAKSHYPEEHDERAEIEWVVEAFASYLEPELEKGKGKGKRAARDVGSYQEEKSDDSEVEEGQGEGIVVKKEGLGKGKEDDEGMPTGFESKMQSQHKQIEELKLELEALERKKRQISAPEPPKAKRAKIQHGKESASVQEKAAAGEGDDPVPERKVVYTAVSRGLAISNISRARRDRAVGWPWSKAGKAGIVIVGKDGAKES